MTNKIKLILSIVALTISFAAGRLSVAAPEVKTDAKQTSTSDQHEVQDTSTTTVTVKQPDGAETTTTKTDTTTKIITIADSTTDVKTDILPPKANTLNVSALGGYYFGGRDLVYGVHISKQFIGPISAGLWGLNNGTIGVSVGINF